MKRIESSFFETLKKSKDSGSESLNGHLNCDHKTILAIPSPSLVAFQRSSRKAILGFFLLKRSRFWSISRTSPSRAWLGLVGKWVQSQKRMLFKSQVCFFPKMNGTNRNKSWWFEEFVEIFLRREEKKKREIEKERGTEREREREKKQNYEIV